MEDILRPIGDIGRALDSIANVEFLKFNLTKGQYLYLVRICEHPGIVQGHLAEMIKIDRTTAARVIQKLEQRGIIERRVDARNQKLKRLYPTPLARQIYPKIIAENQYSNQVALQGFSVDEADELRRLLNRVNHNIGENWNYVKQGHHRQY